MLYDTQFPLFNKEMTRAEFDSKVQENPLNDHLKVAIKQPEEKAVEYDIGMGYLGNGLTVWNRADRFGLDWSFLCGGNNGTGTAFAVLQRVDLNIVPSVGQHCKVGFQAVLRKSYHWDTGVVIDGTGSLHQVKSCPYDFCIIRQAAEREKPKDAALPEFYQAYLKTKADNPGSLLLYQVGDFFEAYADDAEVVGTALDLVQTTRAVDHNTRVPMVR